MHRVVIGKVLLGLFCFAVIANLGVCFADDGPVNGGDPMILPPGCKTLEPTTGILSEILTMLVTVILPTLF